MYKMLVEFEGISKGEKKVLKKYCDFCGKEIYAVDGKTSTFTHYHSSIGDKYDICLSCASKIMNLKS